MEEKKLLKELQGKVKKRLVPLFSRYNMDFTELESALKWKPTVLIIGNYSSGKSTLINEFIGQDIQRTGQAPTDDSFTIITCDPNVPQGETPGSTVVADTTLPFTGLRKYGHKLVSHLCLKHVENEALANMAIIDSPGMLDSTSEKDRGYDYMAVLGDIAKMADLIVLMFDPHKAGTIRETYTAIRNTLPEKSGEDRIVFVMSRIDECDNLSDLTRSYGTLCWNMSQMTGRKDIPHIYLTYSPEIANSTTLAEGWPQEREDLIETIKKAPNFQMNHVLEDIGRQMNEVQIVSEALTNFTKKCKKGFWTLGKITLVLSALLFLFGDMITKAVISYPETTLFSAFRADSITLNNLIIPIGFAAVTIILGLIIYAKIIYKQQLKRALNPEAELVALTNDYRKNLWHKMKGKVHEILEKSTYQELWSGHGRNLARIKQFLAIDLVRYYDRIRK